MFFPSTDSNISQPAEDACASEEESEINLPEVSEGSAGRTAFERHEYVARKRNPTSEHDANKVIVYLHKKPKREKPDDMDLFFASACESTRKFPRRLRNKIKREILDLISRVEDEFELEENISRPASVASSSGTNESGTLTTGLGNTQAVECTVSEECSENCNVLKRYTYKKL